MNTSGQGYQLLAVGDLKYLNLAIRCAASIKCRDKARPIQLVTDLPSDIVQNYPRLFDDITSIVVEPEFAGPLIKLKMYEFSIYQETLFVDADCLLMKDDIDLYWKEMSSRYVVTTPGTRRSEGEWYKTSIEKICDLAKTSSIVQMNSGVLYFKRNERAKVFFDTAIGLVSELGNFTGHIHQGRGLPDEPYLAIAFSRCNVDPMPVVNAEGNGLMVSTIGSSDFIFDSRAGVCRFKKGDKEVSPTICHFVGLRPEDEYERLSKEFLDNFLPK